jgi:hypothetical protein
MKTYDRRTTTNPWPTTGTPSREPSERDPIDEAAEASFPASDPPAFTGASATPSFAPSDDYRKSRTVMPSQTEKE